MTLDGFFAVFLAISTVVLTIAVYYLSLGLWPMMAVSILHVFAVGWCFRAAWRNNWFKQTICFDRESLTIEHQSAVDSWKTTWPTVWLRVVSILDKHGENRVYLCQHNQRQQIGEFLPQCERNNLEKVIKKALEHRTAWSTQHKQETMST